MSKIEGGVPVTGFISPTDSEDTYATHKDIYGQGGYRSVANIEERDAIPVDRRSEGMLVFVKENNFTYQLIGGTDNTNWVTKGDSGIDELTKNYIIVGNELNEPQASAALIDVHEDIAIIYERLDQIQGVGTGGGTQGRGTRDLSGFVVGDVEPDGSMYTTRGPDCVLTAIPAGGDVDLSLNRIVNVADPYPDDGTPAGDFGQYDATNRNYVDKHKWLSESITDLDSTIKGYSLDQFNPPAVNLNLNGKVLGNVATSTNPNDVATVEYVNNALEETGGSSPITLTGAVTGSGTGTIETKLTDITVSQITDFTSSVNSIISNTPLNNLAYPTGSLDMKSQTIINLNDPDPENGSAATNVQFVQDYVDNAVDNIDKSVTLTGAVTGSGTGTINTTLTPSAVTSFRLDQFAAPTASVNMNSQRLTGLAAPTQGTDATNKTYVDSTASNAVSNRTTTLTGAVTGSGTGNTINTTLTPSAVTSFRLDQFAAPTTSVSMGSQKISSLAAPTLGTDATNKTYVDSTASNAVSNRTTTLTGAVTGSGTGNTINTTLTPGAVTSFRLDQFAAPTTSVSMGSQKISSLAAPTLGTDATNKTYVDSTASNAVSNRTTTLTGAITGSGTGNTISTTLTPITTSQISNFDTSVRGYSLSDFTAPTGPLSMSGRRIVSLASPTEGDNATNKTYVDSTASNAVSNRTTTLTGAVTGSGTGNTINTTLTPSAVTSFRLDQFAAPTASVNMNSQRLTGLAAPTQGTDATNKTYVDSLTHSRPYGCLITVNNTTVSQTVNTFVSPITVPTTLSTSSREFEQLSNGMLRCNSATEYLYNIKATLEIQSYPNKLTFLFALGNVVGQFPSFSIDINESQKSYIIVIESEAISLGYGDYIRLFVSGTNTSSTIKIINQTFQAIPI